MTRILIGLLLAGLFLPALPAQDLTPAEQAFYRAYYQQHALRDLQAARQTYASAADLAASARNDDLVKRALLQQADIAQQLGNAAAAQRLYERVLLLDPGNASAKAALSAPGKSATDDELALRIATLIDRLAGPDREQARKDLALLGELAVPQLEKALRSRDIGVVSAAARLLWGAGGDPGATALAQALRDSEVLFPKQVVDAVREPRVQTGSARLLRVIAGGLRHPTSNVRNQLLRELRAYWYDGVPENVTSSFEKLLREVAALGADFRAVVYEQLGFSPQAWHVLLPFVRDDLTSQEPRRRELGIHALLSMRQLLASTPPDFQRLAAEVALDLMATHHDRAEEACSILEAMKLPEDLARRVHDLVVDLIRSGDAPLKSDWFTNWVSRELPPELVVDLYAVAANSKQVRIGILGGLLQRVPKDKLGNLFLAGWKRIEDPEGKKTWLYLAVEDPAVLIEAAGDEDPEVRKAVYQWVNKPKVTPPGSVLTTMPLHLAEDIASPDEELRRSAMPVALHYRSPRLALPVRRFLELERAAAGRWSFLLNVDAQRLLCELGDDAGIPALRTLIREGLRPDSGTLTHMVQVLGDEVLDDMLAIASMEERGSAPLIVSFPAPIIAAYVQRLPRELVDGTVVNVALRALDRGSLQTFILRLLAEGPDAALADAAKTAGIKHMTAAVPELLRLTESTNVPIREAARQALREIQEHAALEAQLVGFGPKERAAALEEARSLLQSADAAQRRGAAFALAALGDPGVVPDLMKLLRDPDDAVREAAVEALRRLGAAKDL